MLTINTKLICDVCGEIDIVELEYNISARAGSPPILMPNLPYNTHQLYEKWKFASNGYLVCSEKCKSNT